MALRLFETNRSPLIRAIESDRATFIKEGEGPASAAVLLPVTEKREALVDPLRFVSGTLFLSRAERLKRIEGEASIAAGQSVAAKATVPAASSVTVDFKPGVVETLDRPVNGMPPVGQGVAKSAPDERASVRFSPIRVPIWQRGDLTDIAKSMSEGGIADAQIPKGTYLFTFEISRALLPKLLVTKPMPFSVLGKEQTLDKGYVDFEKGEAKLQVTIRENFIGIIIASTAALVAAGFAAYQSSKALKQVDAIILDTGDAAIKVGVIGLVGFGSYLLFKKARSK